MAKVPYSELTPLHKKAYGQWAGNNRGQEADPNLCCEEILSGWHFVQCSKRRGHGPENAYCKIHDPAAVMARRAKADEKYRSQYEKDRIKWAGPQLLTALRQIAAGHNDPRALAMEAIKDFPEAAKTEA